MAQKQDRHDSALATAARETAADLLQAGEGHAYRALVDEVEKPLLEMAMKHSNGNQVKTALALGINRATLRTKLQRHGLL